MEEEFLLVYYGKFTKSTDHMTAEERAWWIKRLNKEAKRAAGKNDTESSGRSAQPPNK